MDRSLKNLEGSPEGIKMNANAKRGELLVIYNQADISMNRDKEDVGNRLGQRDFIAILSRQWL